MSIDTMIGHPLFPDTQIRPIRNLGHSPSGAQQYLVQDTRTDKYYVVSGVVAMFTGWEVLIFEGDAEGNVTDWGEVAGGRGIDFMEAVKQLEFTLANPNKGWWDYPDEEEG